MRHLFRVLSFLICVVSIDIGHSNAQSVVEPGFDLNLYFSLTNAGTGGSGAHDIVIGNGGPFGNDLFVADFGAFTGFDGNGRVWRVSDSDEDGNGEGFVFSTAVGTPYRSPAGLAVGIGGASPFGNSLFLLDYPSPTSQRFVYQVSETGSVTQFSTSTIFNPNGLEAHPDGNRLLVNDSSAFTVFGGTDDATIFQVSPTGAVSGWANGSNNPNGLWDISSDGRFSPDGWFTILNNAIGASFMAEFVQFQDLNCDGDANDPGESRVIIGTGAGLAGGCDFDDHGNFYYALGNNVFKCVDLNGDGDYWDFTTSTFDPGEQSLFAQDLGQFVQRILCFESTLFVSVGNSNGTSDIFQILESIVSGDVNGDGVVDLLDISPFVELLAEGIFQEEADLNGDGLVNLLDIAPFVALLEG